MLLRDCRDQARLIELQLADQLFGDAALRRHDAASRSCPEGAFASIRSQHLSEASLERRETAS